MPLYLVEIIVFTTIGLLVALNFVLNINPYKNDTINVIIKNWSYNKFYFITFLWGVLGGHFFLGNKTPIKLFIEQWWLPPLLLAIIVIIMILHGKKLPKDYRVKPIHQITLLVLGLLYGHFIWSQRHEELINFTL